MATTKLTTDVEQYLKWAGADGTTQQQYQEFVRNMYGTLSDVVKITMWQPNTSYPAGAVLVSPDMPVNTLARAVVAGTTGDVIPTWGAAGNTIVDGTVKWTMLYRTMDEATQEKSGYMSARDKAKLDGIAEDATNVTDYVQSVTESNGKVTVTKGGGETNTFDAGMTQEQLTNFFYPIGSVYMSADKNKTKADFPFMQYGTWEEVPAASCLETADASHAAGSTVSAGLPNLTGTYDAHRCGCYGDGNVTATGVFKVSGYSGAHSGAEGNWSRSIVISFDASKSNSIYGASTTVQPKAFFVKAWRRTA